MTEIVEGKPIRIGERELIPIVRLETGVRRRAFVGSETLSGHGWGFVRMRPVAVVERDGVAERRIPIRNRTIDALAGLLMIGCVIPLLLMLAVYLMRRS